jgi:hypothetical protein
MAVATATANPYVAALMDFSKPVDVEAVESTVGLFYGTGTPEQVRLQPRGGQAAAGWACMLPWLRTWPALGRCDLASVSGCWEVLCWRGWW